MTTDAANFGFSNRGLECVGCGSEIFVRQTALFYEDEAEACAECGMLHVIRVSDEGYAYASSNEHHKDIGQPKCDNACGLIHMSSPVLVAEYMGTPCAWTCEKTKAWKEKNR